MTEILSPADELDRLYNRSAAPLLEVLEQLAAAIARRRVGQRADLEGAREAAAARFGDFAELGNLLGRRRMLLAARHVRVYARAARGKPLYAAAVVEKQPFREAVFDLYHRHPKLASSAAEVRRLYQTEKAFAMVRSAEVAITDRVRQLMVDSQLQGITVDDASEIITSLGKFNRAYAENVFRTNLATVYTEGQKQQARDPEVREVVPAFRFAAVGDSDTRPGHRALDGLIAGVDAWVWGSYSPPIYYQCRCSLDWVDRFELEERGLIDSTGAAWIFYPATWPEREREELFSPGA